MNLEEFKNTKTYKVIRTLAKVFVTSAVGQLIIFGDGILDLTTKDAKMVLASAIAAVLLTAGNALNKNYTDYGIGSNQEE